MSENDLIRRGDVLRLFEFSDRNENPAGCRYVEHAQGYCGCEERTAAVRALPASPAFPPDAVERAAQACWDYDRECDWSEADAVEREAYYEEARAVLSALVGGA